jgi:hypothetical protein
MQHNAEADARVAFTVDESESACIDAEHHCSLTPSTKRNSLKVQQPAVRQSKF